MKSSTLAACAIGAAIALAGFLVGSADARRLPAFLAPPSAIGVVDMATVFARLEESAEWDVRLKALQMLGNVTEVALFTERVEVTKKDASEEELESRLRERLARFMKKPVPVEVVDVIELNAPVKNA